MLKQELIEVLGEALPTIFFLCLPAMIVGAIDRWKQRR